MKRIVPRKERLEDGFNRVIPKEIYAEDNLGNAPLDITAFQGDTSAVIKKLESMYEQREIPSDVIFDYTNPRTNIHNFLRELYIKQNLHIFRNIPVSIVNYSEEDKQLVDPIKVLAVNGSPRKNGDTKRMLKQEVDRYWTGPYYNTSFIDLENIEECIGCGGHQKNCKPECVIEDQMFDLVPKVKDTDVLLLGSPVYMDLPTSRTLAFLSRLTGETKRNRRTYIGKYASTLSSAWCSGTKPVISSLNNALEMMGFTIQGRSSREHIQLWKDDKTRGGVPEDFYWPD